MPTKSSIRGIASYLGKSENKSSLEKTKELDRKVEQLRALRQTQKISTSRNYSKSAAIKCLSPAKASSARERLQNTLSPKDNKEIAEAFRKCPQMRDGLYYKLKDKKITTSKLRPLLSRSNLSEADDTLRRIERGSEILSAQSTSRKEKLHAASEIQTLDFEESGSSFLQQQSLDALHQSHVLSKDSNSLFRLYRVRSDQGGFQSLDRPAYQSYCDESPKQQKSEWSNRCTPLQLEPQEVPSPSRTPSPGLDALDYDESMPPRQFKSVEPIRSLTPLMLPVKQGEIAKVVESSRSQKEKFRSLPKSTENIKKITAETIMSLRRNSAQEKPGDLLEPETRERASTALVLTKKQYSLPLLSNRETKDDLPFQPAVETTRTPSMSGIQSRQDSPVKLPSLAEDSVAPLRSIGVTPPRDKEQAAEGGQDQRHHELSATPKQMKEPPRSYSSLSLSSSSPPDRMSFQQQAINGGNNFAGTAGTFGGAPIITSHLTTPPQDSQLTSPYHTTFLTDAQQFKEIQEAVAFHTMNPPGVKQFTAQPDRPESSALMSCTSGDGQQTFRAPDQSYLNQSFSRSTLHGFPRYVEPSPDTEQSVLLAQYEYIVQGLSNQVKTLLQRNAECERILQTQRLTPEFMERLRFSEERNLYLESELSKARKAQEIGFQELKDSNKSASSQVELLRGQLARAIQSEQESRLKTEEAVQRCFEHGLALQQRDEDAHKMKQHISALDTEVRNLRDVKVQLEKESAAMQERRGEIEVAFQEQRKSLYGHQLLVRNLQNEAQNYKLERASLLNSQMMLQKAVEELNYESAHLKSSQSGAQQEKLLDKQTLARSQRQNQRLQAEVNRLSNLLALQRQAFGQLQRDYESAVGNAQSYQHPVLRMHSPIPSVRPARSSTAEPMLPSELANMPPLPPGIPPSSTPGQILETEPSRLQRLPESINYFQNRAHSLEGAAPWEQISPTHPRRTQQSSNYTSIAVYNTQGSTEESMAFPSVQMGGGGAESPIEDPSHKYEEFRQRQVSSKMVGSLLKWSEDQHATEAQKKAISNAQPANLRRPLSSEPAQYQSQRTEGGESPLVTFPSYEKYEREKQRIRQIEGQLRELQLVKKKLENEYSKVPVKGSKRVHRKEELEKQLDSTDKSINQLKQRLRDMNVYSFHYA